MGLKGKKKTTELKVFKAFDVRDDDEPERGEREIHLVQPRLLVTIETLPLDRPFHFIDFAVRGHEMLERKLSWRR